MTGLNSILHITSWLSRAGGGIPPVVRALAAQFRQRQLECYVGGLADPSGAPSIFPEDWPVMSGRIVGPSTFGYSPELRAALFVDSTSLTPDSLIHVHGLWMYPGLLARQLSRRTRAALVISPHGMLEPWALQNSRWKKRFAALVFEDRNLRIANCLHALCKTEAENIRRYGLKNPIAVIPNGVDLAEFSNPPPRDALEARFPALKGRRWALFLSRIHPKKGLPHLLRAWKSVVHGQSSGGLGTDWTLVIAGPDEVGHGAQMKILAAELNIDSRVVFTGPLHGEEKMAVLAGSGLFILPSFSEGFSMSVLEAAAAGLPVMLTPQCNFPELAQAGGAIEVFPDAAGCEAGLRHLLAFTDAERRAMGQRGRCLASRSYSWPHIADNMLSVYHWILGNGPRPDCVTSS